MTDDNTGAPDISVRAADEARMRELAAEVARLTAEIAEIGTDLANRLDQRATAAATLANIAFKAADGAKPRRFSIRVAIMQILRDEGRPMTQPEIRAALLERYDVPVQRESLSPIISRATAAGDLIKSGRKWSLAAE